jgi:hypothetical protein
MMKYFSLDLETTCIDPKEPKNVLGIASIYEDSDLALNEDMNSAPSFCAIVDHGERISGSPFALKLNEWILDGISDANKEGRDYAYSKDGTKKYPILLNVGHCEYNFKTIQNRYKSSIHLISEDQYGMFDVWKRLDTWLTNVSGINQWRRLNAAGKNFGSFDFNFLPEMIKRRFRHRFIDPGSVLVDWAEECLPDSKDIRDRHLDGGEVTHDMLEDAWDVIRALRTTYLKNTKEQ